MAGQPAGLFEYDDVEGLVHDKIQEIEASWRGLLSTLTAQAIQQGHLRRDLDIDQFVWELYGIYLSHHVSARFIKSPDADKRAQTAFAAVLSRAGADEKSEKTMSRIPGYSFQDRSCYQGVPG